MYKKQYEWQKYNAKRRNIDFLLTYEEWISIWGDKITLRGRGKGKYCMARLNDTGPYSIDNIEIILFEQNNKDQISNGKNWLVRNIKKVRYSKGKEHYSTYPIRAKLKSDNDWKAFDTIKEASEYFKVDRSTIIRNLHGKTNGKILVEKI